jgi:mRNA interferase MazF
MQKYDIILVDLNPVRGSEQAGIRPCVILQNDYANAVARTFVIAIISSVIKKYPHTLIVKPTLENGLTVESRIDCLQVRTIDQERIVKHLGTLDMSDRENLDDVIRIAFGV